MISSGWQINDLQSLADIEGNGIDDVVARRAGTEDFSFYPTTVENGRIVQGPAQPFVGSQRTVYDTITGPVLVGQQWIIT